MASRDHWMMMLEKCTFLIGYCAEAFLAFFFFFGFLPSAASARGRRLLRRPGDAQQAQRPRRISRISFAKPLFRESAARRPACATTSIRMLLRMAGM